MHNIKEAIYENKSKLEGIGEDYQIQVSNDPFSCDLALPTSTRNLFFKVPCAVDVHWFPTAPAAPFICCWIKPEWSRNQSRIMIITLMMTERRPYQGGPLSCWRTLKNTIFSHLEIIGLQQIKKSLHRNNSSNFEQIITLVFVFREAVPKTTFSSEPCRAWSATSTWLYLMHTFMNRYYFFLNILIDMSNKMYKPLI